MITGAFLPNTVNASATSGGINWNQLCQQANAIIIPPCNRLVTPNNVLTFEGERVWGCVRNGLLLAGGGTFLLNLPLPVVIGALRFLAEQTGCGDIIEWNFAGSIDNLRGVIDTLT